MNNIDTIMRMIDWNNSETEQQRGIEMAREVTCLKAFFQPFGPGYNKNVWENCARILYERSDEELEPYISDMLIWLQDLNWPGAETILKRLKEFQRLEMLEVNLKQMVPALTAINDDIWLKNISIVIKSISAGR